MSNFKFLFICSLTLLVGCKKKEKQDEPITETPKQMLEIKVVPYFGSEPLDLNNVYTTAENYKIQFFDLKCYLGNFKNGNSVLSSIGFFDFPVKGTSFLSLENDYTKFSNLSFIVGVDSVDNHADPNAFPNDNPLNSLIAGEMHWDWNPGYIFLKIDGKVDTIPDATTNMDHFFSYHVGKDENRVALSFSNISWKTTSSTIKTATIKIDLAQFLLGPNPIDIRSEFKTHSEAGTETLNLKVIQNFAGAISFEP